MCQRFIEKDAYFLTCFMNGRLEDEWWTHKEAVFMARFISVGSYFSSNLGSASSWTFFESRSGLA